MEVLLTCLLPQATYMVTNAVHVQAQKARSRQDSDTRQQAGRGFTKVHACHAQPEQAPVQT